MLDDFPNEIFAEFVDIVAAMHPESLLPLSLVNQNRRPQ